MSWIMGVISGLTASVVVGLGWVVLGAVTGTLGMCGPILEGWGTWWFVLLWIIPVIAGVWAGKVCRLWYLKRLRR